MALTTLGNTNTAYREALRACLPRGPIWDTTSQPTLGALIAGMALEPKRAHNRLVDALAETDPRTADELLDEWVAALDLPAPCGTLPTDEDALRAMVAAKVAATGGQSRAYFLGIIRGAIRPFFDETIATEDLATITERPYGRPFRAWSGHAWEDVNGIAAMFYWRVTAAMDTPAEVQATLECLIEHYKPAHTVLEWSWTLAYEVGP